MHPNPTYRKTSTDRSIAFARERSFGILSVNADPAPLLSHIPFQLGEDGERLEAHLTRSNPIVRLLGKPQAAVIAVSGPDGYVSPDWYGIGQQVPTWNYVAVHLRGVLRLLPQQELRGILERLATAMETRLLPKPVWTLDKLSDETFGKMSRMIVPLAMEVEQIEGTWKLGQTKPAGAVLGAAEGLEQSGFGAEVAKLAALMRGAPD